MKEMKYAALHGVELHQWPADCLGPRVTREHLEQRV